MPRIRVLGLCIAGTLASAAPLLAQSECENRRELTATVDATGSDVVRLETDAGSLTVTGRPGIGQVRVSGTACAPRSEDVDDLQIIAERRGSEAFIETIIPESDGWFSRSGNGRIDLVIEMPESARLMVTDGSGSIEIFQTRGGVEVHDGSGSLTIRDAEGDVRVSDGSGSIEIESVRGSTVVDTDGSGSIDIMDVTGSVLVAEDGSGSIRVRRVGGDFTVERDGSGGIDEREIAGAVRLPRRR